ncbi:MAG TPA: hypothetical protein VIK91_14895 [Nannocystis sp.]
MSLVLLPVLIVYATLRVAFWTRGQWRFYRLRRDLPRARAPAVPPPHLAAPLVRLLGDSHAQRVRLADSARRIATALIVDPDVPFGVVRDFNYRLALAEAWSATTAWLAAWDALGEHERLHLEELGYTPHTFAEHRDRLGVAVRKSVRAPALEPFAVAEVAAAQRLVLALIDDLDACERALVSAPLQTPYRAVA